MIFPPNLSLKILDTFLFSPIGRSLLKSLSKLDVSNHILTSSAMSSKKIFSYNVND